MLGGILGIIRKKKKIKKTAKTVFFIVGALSET